MTRALPFLLIAVAAGFLGDASPSPPSSPGPGRPVVLLVHGRGVQGQDSATLRGRWRDALGRGLEEMAGRSFLQDDDLRVVWYAEALRPELPAACATPPTPLPGSPAREPLGEALAAAGELLAMASELVDGPEATELRSIAGDLLYLGDDERRCAAEEHLTLALERSRSEGRPVILVAHSFGALVSYRHLRRREPGGAPAIERYVTVGSLLGHPALRQLLLEGPGATAATRVPNEEGLPPGVGSWVNVRDPADPFAAPLVGLVDGEQSAILDKRTERSGPGDPHDLGRYLADPATAGAILEAWCRAVPGSVSQEECGSR